MSDTIHEIPRLWLNPTDSNAKKCLADLQKCAKSGGDALSILENFVGNLGIHHPDPSSQVNVSEGSPLLATPGGGRFPLLTMVIVNMLDKPLELAEKITYAGELLAYPVVKQYIDDTFTTQKTMPAPSKTGKSMSRDSLGDGGNDHIWIDSAAALGTGAASVGVFRFKSTAAPFYGVSVSMRFSGGSSLPHFYVAAERCIGDGGSSAAVDALTQWGKSDDFYKVMVDNKSRHTSQSNKCYCATYTNENDDHNIATFIAATS